MELRDYNFMEKVAETYRQENESLRATAIKMDISRTKVRKILVTLGEIETNLTIRADKLKKEGKELSEIAGILGVSVATVSTYLPYDTVIYNGEEKSLNAIRHEIYRKRKKIAGEKQVYINEKTITGKADKIMAKTYKLHLELDIEGADMEVLKKYGKVKKGITRDILAPANMTLHALNYAIQKLFGWENCHLHHFELPEEIFGEVAGDKFLDWVRYAGVYFRFPTDDNEDIYWDDDYDERKSVKSWLRSKYNGSYEYHGMFEHFMEARYAAEQFVTENKQMRISIPFNEWREMNEAERNKPRIKNISDVTTEEAHDYFLEIGGLKQLLERLTIEEVFGEGTPTEVTKRQYEENLLILINAHNRYVQVDDEAEYWNAVNPLNPKASPITKELFYEYDYGDDWRVKISFDGMEDDLISAPVCVAADGLPVLDDVGGISGYCEMLTGLHGDGSEHYDYDESESTKEWARGMGWTGRMSKPENML